MNPPPDPLLTVDLAHPPRPPEVVEEQLQEAVASVHRSGNLRVLKIVHGYGSSGKGGSTREVVLNWLFRHRRRLKAVVEGTSYRALDPATADMRGSVGQYPDPDLGRDNPGVTIVWIK